MSDYLPADTPSMVASEFLRRLRHQLARQRQHDDECSIVDCRQAKLISCGLADSWTTLVGIGFGREAALVCASFDKETPG